MDVAALIPQVVALITVAISSGLLVKVIDGCVSRARQKALDEAEQINVDLIESKLRTMLYGENMGLRKDLDDAHDKIRLLQKNLLQAEMTIADMERRHMEEMTEVNARLRLTEERLAESERARALLQLEHTPSGDRRHDET